MRRRVRGFSPAGAEMQLNFCVRHGKPSVPSGSQTPNRRSLRQPANSAILGHSLHRQR